MYQKSSELAKNAGISSDGIIYNRQLLRYYGVISDDNLLSTLYTLAAVVIVLIMVGSVSLIYNAFAISISERSRHLGMMYLIYEVLGNSFEFAFAVPWGSVLAAVVVVFLIVGSTILYASSKIKHENIIDVLKEENI